MIGRRIQQQLSKFLLLPSLAVFPILVVLWYIRNGASMQAHVKVSTSAEFWGERGIFREKFLHWTTAFADHFFLHFALILTLLIGAIVLVRLLLVAMRRQLQAASLFDVAAVASSLQILLSLSAFSLVPNEDGRYLLPLAPYLALFVAWLLSKLSKPWSVLAFVVYIAQLSSVHAQALGFTPKDQQSIPWLIRIEPELVIHDRIAELASVTCSVEEPGHVTLIELGVDLNVLNTFTLAYIAASGSSDFLGLRSKPCDYISSVKQAKDLAPLIRSLDERRPRYLVAIDDLGKLPDWMAPEFTNQVSAQVTPDFARTHGYRLECKIGGFMGTSISIYRRGKED
jgi:hypothetical protein